MVIACVIFLVGFGISSATFSAADRDHRLKQEALVTDAVVKRTWSEPVGRGNGRQYKVAYTFSAEGQTLEGESQLPQRNWKGLSTGSHTPVKYVPGHLYYNRLTLAYESMQSYWVSLVVFVIWIVILATGVLPIRMERFLLRYGQPAPGIITNIKATSGGRSPKYGYILTYEFQLSDGTIVNGKTRRDVARSRAEITVLYDPKHPRRSDIYPTRLAMVKS